MTGYSIVAVTFQDLSDAAANLSSGNSSPKAVRQSFARFLSASQQLTEHMRKEYKTKTGESWDASGFDGWNDVTALFKELRNVDQHEHPVTVLVHETQYFRTYEGGPEVAVAGTWSFSLEDQLLDNPRDDLRLELADPETGQPSGTMVAPVRKEYEFHLVLSSVPSSPKARKARTLLTKMDDPNVRALSEQCFKVLTQYYQYYQRQLAQS